jgi:EmrB/QacA subfamily drug resistance transporter
MSKSTLVALIVACAFFMQGLDSTIVATAIPQIAVSFHESPVRLSGAITSYILSLAIFIPISGWMADRFGARTIFQTAIILFSLGSIFCGLSSNVLELNIARVLQGIGGAMLVPVGRLVMLRTVGKAGLVAAMAVLSVPAQTGPLLGPPIGGLIVTYFSWHWIFLVNVPIGLIGVIFASIHVENFKEAEQHSLDWMGFILSGCALACIMYALDSVGRGDAGTWEICGFLAVGLSVGVFAVRHARTHPHPLIDLSLIRIPTFAANFWGGTLFRIGLGTVSFMLPLLFQVVFGMTAFASGLLIFASALGSVAMKATTPPILRRFGFRNVVTWNGVLGAAALFACGLFTSATPIAVIFLVLLVSGFVQSLQFSSLNSLPYADVPAAQMSAATSLSQLMQQVGRGTGVAMAAAILHLTLSWRGDPRLTTVEFLIAFSVSSAVSLSSVFYFVRLPRNAGAELSGHRTC